MILTRDFTIIRCPKCGYEYTAAEIFYPEDLLGRPEGIMRDDRGHIVFVEGEQPQLSETYDCNECGTTFRATLSIVSSCTYNKALDDDDVFVIDLKADDKETLF